MFKFLMGQKIRILGLDWPEPREGIFLRHHSDEICVIRWTSLSGQYGEYFMETKDIEPWATDATDRECPAPSCAGRKQDVFAKTCWWCGTALKYKQP